MMKRIRNPKKRRLLSHSSRLKPTRKQPIRNTNSVETPKWSFWAIALAIAPTMGYFYAFTYEKGYMSYFSVPQHFISLNIVTVFAGTMFVLKTIVYVSVIIALVYVTLFIFKPVLLKQFNQLGFIFTMYIIAIYIAYVYGRGFTTESHFFLVMIGVYIFKYYIMPLMFEEFGATASERFKNYQEQYTIPKELFTMSNKELGGFFAILKYFVLLILVVTLPQLVGDNFGYREARVGREYMVIDSDGDNKKEMVVLRIYDYTTISAPFDRKTRNVLQEFKIIDIRDLELPLKLEEIGPLTPVRCGTNDN